MQVIGPRRPGHAGEGFARAALLADVSLLPEGPNEDPTGHRAVALASGYLDARHDELVLAPRKQVCCRIDRRPQCKSPITVRLFGSLDGCQIP